MTIRHRRTTEQLEQAGGDATFAQRAEVALEPAILAHCGEVVDHAEEAKPNTANSTARRAWVRRPLKPTPRRRAPSVRRRSRARSG